MNIKEEIKDYIFRKELTGALLLTGEWGCGKSYLVKEIAKELNENKRAAVAVISLFGLDSVATINHRVKEEYFNLAFGSVGKAVKKVSKGISTVAKDGLAVANAATDGLPGLGAASQGVSAIMSYDLFGFISVKNTVGKGRNSHNFVLIFDDLERCNITPKDLLGAINEYVENKQIKVIIVAEEGKITSDKYKEYKEKLISRTLRMRADYQILITNIIKKYSQTAKGYSQFLIENRNLIIQAFCESKTNNLRIVRTILSDFERIYEAWKETEVKTDNLKWVLYTFACEVFLSKMPPAEEKHQEKGIDYFLIGREGEQYKDKGKNNSYFISVSQWIYDGVWVEERFKRELVEKYGEKKYISDFAANFISGNFWGLDQDDIDKGLPKALDLAYDGALSANELIWLISRIHSLKAFGVALPIQIDYGKMQIGLEKRIERLKNGDIEEPRCSTFATQDQIDPEARHFYKQVKSLDERRVIWENRIIVWNYLCGDGSIRDNLILDSFDNNLFEHFIKHYGRAKNYTKRDFGRFLCQWTFDDKHYSTEADLATTKSNIMKLIEWLDTQKSEDTITMMINRLFSDELKKHRILRADCVN